MTNLTSAAEAHLQDFEQAYNIYMLAKIALETKIREQAEAELTQLRNTASYKANLAVAAGVPVLRLGTKGRTGLNTKNWNTIKDFLAHTKSEAISEAIAGAGESSRYQWTTDGTILVTLTGADWDEFRKANVKLMRDLSQRDESTTYLNREGRPLKPEISAIMIDNPATAFIERNAEEAVAEWLELHPAPPLPPEAVTPAPPAPPVAPRHAFGFAAGL